MSKTVDDLKREMEKIESLENDLETMMLTFSNLVQNEQKRFEQKIAETVGFQKNAFATAGKKVAELIEENDKIRKELSCERSSRRNESAKWITHFRRQEEKVFQLQSEKIQTDNELKTLTVQLEKAEEKEREIARLEAELKKMKGQAGTDRFEMANLKTELDELRKRDREHREEIGRLNQLVQNQHAILDQKQQEIMEKDRAHKRLASHLGEIQKLSFELKTSSHEKEKDLYKYRNGLREKSRELEHIKHRNDELSHQLLKQKERIAQLLEFNREQNGKAELLYRELHEEKNRNSRLQAEIGALKTRSLFWEEGREQKRQNSPKEARRPFDETGLDFIDVDEKDSTDQSIF